MTPAQIRADHTLTASAGCGRCRRNRVLRLGVIPVKYQQTGLPMIPFRCTDCGEFPDRFNVQRWAGGRFQDVWTWPPLEGLADH